MPELRRAAKLTKRILILRYYVNMITLNGRTQKVVDGQVVGLPETAMDLILGLTQPKEGGPSCR